MKRGSRKIGEWEEHAISINLFNPHGRWVCLCGVYFDTLAFLTISRVVVVSTPFDMQIFLC